MSLVMVVLWVLGGLLAGLLAGVVMRRGGYGLRWDVIVGLLGSIVGSWLFLALGPSPEAGMLVVVAVAFAGAAIPIVAQRTMWPTTA
ncbi:MAG: GlsB/YeaQ/YmgE family stress response membrane protein [Candidatus Rokubacteria bacterium]|nr:GlsB/YeaQ/YmgE family stress response membrane protein [Candidatus Rokubacteria bacterium]